MTHDEFKKQWARKHRTVFAQMNRLLKEHGIPGAVTGLTMTPKKSVLDSMPADAADDCCEEPCKAPPCGPGEVIQVCQCPDGSGGFKIHRCCVPQD
jgi:hypothetical protein